MKCKFSYFLIIFIIEFVVNLNQNNSKQSTWYNFNNYNQTDIFNIIQIPVGSKYNSNNSCVTYPDLIYYNYSDLQSDINNWNKVYPENFCYGMLTYNISREDFFGIINKNISNTILLIKDAFLNYRKLITLWTIFNYTKVVYVNYDDCAGYFRNIACWSQFPACIDNGDNTWSASPICIDKCDIFSIRCGQVLLFLPKFISSPSIHSVDEIAV